MARPTKLDEDVQRRYVEAIAKGMTYEHAAWYAGVSRQTVYSWRVRAQEERERIEKGAKPRKAEAPFVAFLDEVECALGQALFDWLDTLDMAARDGDYDGTWQAHAWKLERRHPQDYGRHTRTELTGAGGGPVEVAYVVEYPDAPDDYDPDEWREDEEGE